MSAEKEIVNFWYNKKGLFTINNIKTSSNRDAGILALKFDNSKVNEVFHIEVSCSLTNNIAETKNLEKSIAGIAEEKFNDSSIIKSVNSHIRQFSIDEQKIKKILILGSVPKSRKSEIIRAFNQKEVEVIEFENILYDILEQLDTQYYRNDVIRTLQLTKFLLLSEPTKLAKLLSNDAFTSSSRKEFLSSILDNNDIVKEFRKTNMESVASILKNSGLKANVLAQMIEDSMLNKRTRKIFMNSLMEQENNKKIINQQKRIKKLNMPLGRFF